MDSELQNDMEEILEGFDPWELLLHNPDLALVAEELCSSPVVTADIAKWEISGKCSKPDSPTDTTPTMSITDINIQERGNRIQEIIIQEGRIDWVQKRCEVCHRATQCYYHYGALACMSCRAFFSRAIEGKKYKDFTCSGDGLEKICTIDSTAYKSCKKCRFAKCLSSGMKIPLMHSSPTNGNYDCTLPLVHNLRVALAFSTYLTVQEKLMLTNITCTRLKLMMGNISKFAVRDHNIFKQVVEMHFTGQNFTLRTSKAFEDFTVYRLVEALAEPGEFDDNLTQRDRIKLLSRNIIFALDFMEAHKMGMVAKQKGFGQQIDCIIGQLNITKKTKFEEIRDNVLLKGSVNRPFLNYESAYDHKKMGILPGEPARRHRQLVEHISKLKFEQYDSLLLTLIMSIIMYTPDFLDLDHPNTAEQVQTSFAYMLHRYLKGKKTPKGDWLFRECMMVSAYARELREFKEAAYRKNLGKV